MIGATPNASCFSDNESPLLDGSSEYYPPASFELDPSVRILLEEKQDQINGLSGQIEELQAVNYQTTVMMYVFVAISAFLVLLLMFFVMFRRPAPIVRSIH